MTIYEPQHQETGAQPQERLQEHDAPTTQSQTPEDPALNAGSSSIIDTADLESYHAPDPLEHHTGWRRRALRVGAVVAGGAVVVTGAFFVGRSGTKEEKANPTPSTLDFPAPGVSETPTTKSSEAPKVEDRFLPGTQRLAKTIDGHDINYGSSVPKLNGGAQRPETNRDLIDEGLNVFSTRIESVTKSNGKKLLPVAMGECVFYSRTSYIKNDPTPYTYYTAMVNPVKIENGDTTTYYGNTSNGHELMTVGKAADGNVRASFGAENLSVVNGKKNLETNMLPIFQHWEHPNEEPDPNIWGDSGSITYAQAINIRSSRSIIAGIVTISGPPNLELAPAQQEQICGELVEKTNIGSYRTR